MPGRLRDMYLEYLRARQYRDVAATDLQQNPRARAREQWIHCHSDQAAKLANPPKLEIRTKTETHITIFVRAPSGDAGSFICGMSNSTSVHALIHGGGMKVLSR
jgi:hypothetical protein